MAGGQVKTLLIAPRTDLPNVDAEVQAILRSGLDVTPRLGDVRHSDVLADVTSGEYDAFWHAGHATKDGLLLTDGILSASELTPLIKCRFELVVLNSCDGKDTAEMLQRETEAVVIATVTEVPDRLAFQTGALFARELARTGDIYSAYHNAKPGQNRQYVLLGWGKKKVAENVDIRLIVQRLDRMEAAQREARNAQQEMQEAVSRIVALVDGSPAYRIIGIPDRLDAVIKADNEWKRATEAHLMSQDTRIKAIEQTNSPLVITRATLIFMVLVGTACLVAAFLLLTWLQSAG